MIDAPHPLPTSPKLYNDPEETLIFENIVEKGENAGKPADFSFFQNVLTLLNELNNVGHTRLDRSSFLLPGVEFCGASLW